MQIVRKLVWSFISLAIYSQLSAMDAPRPEKGLKEWPAFVYFEAFPSAIAHPVQMVKELPELKHKACVITKELADKFEMDEYRRVCSDWAYALCQIEKTGLLKKPLETYTVEDISLISSWLTRLTAKNPGAFRTGHARWYLKETFTPEEAAKAQAILAKPASEITEEEDTFIQTCHLDFIEEAGILPSLESFLANLKRIEAGFKANAHASEAQKIAAYLDIASYIHLTMVMIHGYEEGSKRLGRVLMFIYLAQRGIEPLTFYHGHVYVDKLIVTLTAKDRDAFKKYVLDTYITNQRMRRNPNYFEVLQQVAASGNHIPEKTHEALLNHPLHKRWEAEQTALMKQREAADAAAQKETISQNKSCAACKKIFDKDNKPMRCSACKAVYYCSAACQKAHWGAHKSICNKK